MKSSTIIRKLLAALTLIFSTALLQSQDASQTAPSPKGTAAAAHATLEGCLTGSDGNYILTDKHGRTYQLQTDTSNLAAHVGHEVLVLTSTPAAIATTSAIGAEETAVQQPTLTVTEVKHVSGSCQTAAGTHE